MIKINGNNHSVTLTADFDAVHTRLKENQCWGADLLQLAGEYEWRVSAARLYSKGPFGAQVIDESADAFVAWGISGNKSCLAYRIERETDSTIRVTPLAYLERIRKISLAVALAMIFILPVLLAPLLWRLYEVQTLRASRIYLPTFARYLEQDSANQV